MGPGCRSLTILVSQGLVDEVCGPFKVGAEVELLRIIGLDAQVGDAGIIVKVGIGVDVHEGPALGGIQDVRDAQFLQLGDVLSYRPGWEAVAENEEAAPQEEVEEEPEPLGKARRRSPLSPVAPPAPSHDLSPHPSHIQLPAASPNRLVVLCPCCLLRYLHGGITPVGCPQLLPVCAITVPML